MDGHGRASYIPPERERRQGFDYWKVLECTIDYQISKYYDNDDPNIKEWDGYDAFAQTEDAAACLREHAESDEPFFMILSPGPPHFPHDNAPEEFQRNHSPAAVTFSPNVIIDDPQFEEVTRREAAGYYAHIAALDRCVGEMLEALETNDLAESTILIFASDHGEMMGSHHLSYPYQLSNLADEPQAADIRSDLEEILTRLLAQIDDPFREGGYYLAKWGYEVDGIGNVPYSQ